MLTSNTFILLYEKTFMENFLLVVYIYIWFNYVYELLKGFTFIVESFILEKVSL